MEGALAAVLEGKAWADPVDVWLNASSGEDLESQIRQTMDALGNHCDADTVADKDSNPSHHAPTASYWTQDLSRCLVQHYDRWIFLKWNLTLPVPDATCARLLAQPLRSQPQPQKAQKAQNEAKASYKRLRLRRDRKQRNRP